MPSTPSRRAFLAGGAGTIAALAGCANAGPTPGTESRPSTDAGVLTPGADDRPTQTPRNPRPVDATGAWPQAGFDAGHAGVSPATGVPADGEPYWQLRRVRSGPAVLADGRLFHYGKTSADRSKTPTLTRTRSSPHGTAHPVYGEPALFARDAATGEIRWYRKLRGPGVGWPAASGNRVLVTVNGQLAAFRARDGAPLWDKDIGDRILGEPTLVDGTAVVPFNGVVDGRSGETLIQQQVRTYSIADGSRGWIVEPPKRSLGAAVSGDTVVVASAGYDGTGIVTGRSLADGSQRWRVELAADFFGGITVTGNAGLVPTSEGTLVALALTDGSERWNVSLDRRAEGVAVGEGTCYVADGPLRALATADGSERWMAGADGDWRYAGVPAVDSDAIYLERRGFPADFVALSRSDGSERWSTTLPEQTVEGDMVMSGLEAQPVVAEGAVYAYAVDGLYAFGPAT